MLYAAMTFWLLVVIFCAWGTLKLYTGLVPPRVVNSVLLPGTFVAQVGRVLGLLATGGTINDTALIRDDGSGEPKTPPNPETRIPVLGPIVVALLPLIACAAAVFAVAWWQGHDMLVAIGQHPVTERLPTSFAAGWQLLRDLLSHAELFLAEIARLDFAAWQTWLFLYLLICFTVRMAPLEGNLRGAVGATLLLGLLAALVGKFLPTGHDVILSGAPILSFAVAVLSVLLLISLAVRGSVALFRLLANGA